MISTLNTLVDSADPLFCTEASRARLARALKQRWHPPGSVFPPKDISDALAYVGHRTYVGPSTQPHGGLGLLAAHNLPMPTKYGPLIGIYSGIVVADRSGIDTYLMDVWPGGPCVRGLPGDTSCIFNKMCRINDPLGQPDRANCVVMPGGAIYQTKPIRANEELCFSYGPEYNWDPVKLLHYRFVCERIFDAAVHMDRPFDLLLPTLQTPADLAEWRSSDGITLLLATFLDYEEDNDTSGTFPLVYWPDRSCDDLTWLELLLRSRHFLRHYGFKGTHRSTSRTMTELLTRVDTKEENKPKSRYGRTYTRRQQTFDEDVLLDRPAFWIPTFAPAAILPLLPSDTSALELDPVTAVSELSCSVQILGNLTILTINMDGGARWNYTLVCDLILRKKADIAILIDTRLNKLGGSQCKLIIRQLGSAYTVHVHSAGDKNEIGGHVYLWSETFAQTSAAPLPTRLNCSSHLHLRRYEALSDGYLLAY